VDDAGACSTLEYECSRPQPDVFAQMPLTQSMKIERLRYMTDPLPNDVLVAGVISNVEQVLANAKIIHGKVWQPGRKMRVDVEFVVRRIR
jgi:hypothetical protein